MGVRSTGSHPTTTKADGHLLEYFRNTMGAGGGGTNPTPIYGSPNGLTATGGVVSDYVSGDNIYRAHVFASSGTLTVSDTTSNFGSTVEYLVVAGGGSGGGSVGGGGGAGGYRSSISGESTGGGGTLESALPVSASPGSYTVTIGAGAARALQQDAGTQGSNSVFGPITSTGGGGGGATAPGGDHPGTTGGSGGGGGYYPSSSNTNSVAGKAGTANQGYAGGNANTNPNGGGGGGGAGAVGGNSTGGDPDPIAGGNGGAGLQSSATGTQHYYAGGGGGAGNNNPPGGNGGAGGGGGGSGSPTNPDVGGQGGAGYNPGQAGGTRTSNGTDVAGRGPQSGGDGGANSGGGGGGGWNFTNPLMSGAGGSGIVVVRYQIGLITSPTKATGGAISFYGGKTIHTFTTSGTFENTSGSPLTVDHIIIAGGGSGGGQRGGGGGAGGVRTSIPGLMPATSDSQVTVSPGSPNAVSVQVGGGAAAAAGPFPGGYAGANGTPSYFGPLIAPGGGGGGGDTTPTAAGLDGGSGGGKAGYDGVATGAASPNSDPSRFGYPGGSASSTAPRYGAAGGGGAGGAGGNGSGSDAGDGGVGKQLPPAFRDPKSSVGAPGPGGGKYWVAGGGGGGIYQPTTPNRGLGGGPGGPYAGGGDGGVGPNIVGASGLENTGGGGGGGSNGDSPSIYQLRGGHGGSGLVLIAYDT